MQIPVLAGRALSEDDRGDHPLVTVVNETMARQFWPRESPIGKSFLTPNGVRTIVGIVADIRERGMGREPLPTFYQSVRQARVSRQTLLIRTAGDPLVACRVGASGDLVGRRLASGRGDLHAGPNRRTTRSRRIATVCS